MKHAIMVLGICLPLISSAMDIPGAKKERKPPEIGKPYEENKEELAFGSSPIEVNKMAVFADKKSNQFLYVAVTLISESRGLIGISRHGPHETELLVRKNFLAPLPKDPSKE